jgi:DNA-directed RNA polymerase sigma subunit (sigma70/sigma32)
MSGDAKQKALQGARRAQGRFEKTQKQLDQHRQVRRASFEQARKAGATLREIGEATGLHWTRIREIVSGR